MKYFVHGGIYKDTSFKVIVPASSLETYGPFGSYDEAKKVWWEKTCRNVDICEHRLFISEEN